MVIPLLPFYAKDMGGGGLWVGVLVSAFSLAQLLSAPVWGRVSDRHGRRPALLIGLGAAAISYVVFAFAQNLWILLLSRLVQGAGGGTVGVLQAYIADATEHPRDLLYSRVCLYGGDVGGGDSRARAFADHDVPMRAGRDLR